MTAEATPPPGFTPLDAFVAWSETASEMELSAAGTWLSALLLNGSGGDL